MLLNPKAASVILGTLAFLAACSGSDTALGDVQYRFGKAFADAFNAPAKSEPAEPGDIVYRGVTGPDPMAEPVDF